MNKRYKYNILYCIYCPLFLRKHPFSPLLMHSFLGNLAFVEKKYPTFLFSPRNTGNVKNIFYYFIEMFDFSNSEKTELRCGVNIIREGWRVMENS